MNTLEELRLTLERHAGGPEDSAGIAQGAEARAGSIRRRRRVAGSAVAAVLVVAAAVGVPVAVGRKSSEPPPPSSVVKPHYRDASQLSVAMADGSPFALTNRGGDGVGQFASIRNRGDITSPRPGEAGLNAGAELLAYNPGEFDPAKLKQGEQVTVAGHPAWFSTALTFAASNVVPEGIYPTIGWEESSGVWVLVYTSDDGWQGHEAGKKAQLTEVADDVRLPAVTGVRTPFQFGWVPQGLPVSYVSIRDLPGIDPDARIGFGKSGYPTMQDLASGWPLSVTSTPDTNRDWPTIKADLGSPATIGGRNVWYVPRPSTLNSSGSPTGADLVVETGNCLVYLSVPERDVIGERDLKRMATEMTVSSCTDAKSWKPPVKG
ncbi:hypothetical protein [Winogradskya humida]|uniref:LigA protein n=1 Tax=Winogradskya humida TaxID=113566 RepID=A0ABQ4A041_9ACTN|nr:hypothetical protein [Actinoplanes humidus]GIE24084.1 hypothetical protein Ahu01nite_071860 [Actinoplanes humidus]